MDDLTLTELRAVDALARERSFRIAATSLGLSRSALSHQVARIEARLGMRLFNRTTRSVMPTEAGIAFVDAIRPALDRIDGAVEGANAFRSSPAGVLRLNGSAEAYERILPQILSFLASHPDMQIEAACEDRLIDIVAEGYDAGLRLYEQVPQDMIATAIGPDEALIIVGSPAYLHLKGLPETINDLARHQCIVQRHSSGALLRWELETEGEARVILPESRLIVGDAKLALEAARLGHGLAYVTAWSASNVLVEGNLVQVMSAYTPPFPGLCLYYPQQRAPSAGLRAFVDHCKKRG